MSTITIELTVDQLLNALQRLPQKDRAWIMQRLGEMDAVESSHIADELPGFGIWKERHDIADSAEYARSLRREAELRHDENHRRAAG